VKEEELVAEKMVEREFGSRNQFYSEKRRDLAEDGEGKVYSYDRKAGGRKIGG